MLPGAPSASGQAVRPPLRPDPVRVAIHVAVYIALFIISSMVCGWVLAGTGYLVAIIATSVLAAGFANWLALRIFEGRHLVDAGLWWNRASSTNLALGLAGGAGSAAAVLLPPLIFRGAHVLASPADRPTAGSIIFLIVLLAAGVLGEELLFRGYAFQILLRVAGPYATILPVGILFALLHSNNPNANWFGLGNTAAFGILFGYAYLRSRDLWLPIGLHLGWNFTLPLFGVNLSGLRMRMTGYEMSWTAGALWSGGDYGPEASVLTSAVVVLLFLYLWKAPIRRQFSPLADPPVENVVCEPSPRLPS
jgi:membrane protease YdiL (CAAX protease family)